MLIEWNKLDFRQRDNNLSHVYAMFSVGWDRAADKPTGHASFEGVASLYKLHPCKTTKVLRKGDCIPGTNAVLQADNYGIYFSDLHNKPGVFVKTLKENGPLQSMTDNFKNPYSGKTTLEIIAEQQASNADNAHAPNCAYGSVSIDEAPSMKFSPISWLIKRIKEWF